MGLDMYMEARKYINRIDWDKANQLGWERRGEAVTPEFTSLLSASGLSEVASKDSAYGITVGVNVCYWRKANQIHKWFVDIVQNGEDNCGEYYVSHDIIKELIRLCTLALANKDPELLPPQEGFFFGSTEIDEYYWGDIQNTLEQLTRLTELPEFEKLNFFYSSSW